MFDKMGFYVLYIYTTTNTRRGRRAETGKSVPYDGHRATNKQVRHKLKRKRGLSVESNG
jgi:hypothetical protein